MAPSLFGMAVGSKRQLHVGGGAVRRAHGPSWIATGMCGLCGRSVGALWGVSDWVCGDSCDRFREPVCWGSAMCLRVVFLGFFPGGCKELAMGLPEDIR